ncbi:MAG: DNA polymerase I, partial [Spirochaetia bacterium]|nr:DNA polymerase I [Spirochaetia bacterium]
RDRPAPLLIERRLQGQDMLVGHEDLDQTLADALRISKALKEHSLKATLLLQIHDELIFEVPQEEVETVHALVKEAMEGAVKLSLPLKTSIETGPSWGDIH